MKELSGLVVQTMCWWWCAKRKKFSIFTIVLLCKSFDGCYNNNTLLSNYGCILYFYVIFCVVLGNNNNITRIIFTTMRLNIKNTLLITNCIFKPEIAQSYRKQFRKLEVNLERSQAYLQLLIDYLKYSRYNNNCSLSQK